MLVAAVMEILNPKKQIPDLVLGICDLMRQI
jgi:hypothetical protein